MAKPLRTIILYSGGHLGSSVGLHFLKDMKEIKIVGIVRGDPAPMDRKGLVKIYYRVKKIGLYFGFLLAWQRFFQFLMFYFFAPFFGKKNLSSGWQVSQKLGIPTYATENINDDASINFIKTLQPDLIISVYFNQILKPETLKLAKKACLNLHPGSLPEYRGAFIYFWVLRNQESEAGVTIHKMDEGIDTGEILSKKYFPIEKTDTQQKVMVKSALVGVRELKKIFKLLQQNKKIEYNEAEKANISNYYKFPNKPDFDRYIKHRRFFRHRDIINLIIRKSIFTDYISKFRKGR